MGQLLRIALRTLSQHRKRNVLLGLAIGLVTALLVVLQGLATGMEETMLRSATTLASGHVNVGGFYKITSGSAAPVVTHYPELETLVMAEVPGVDYVIARMRGWAKVVSDTSSFHAGIDGIDVRRERGLKEVVKLAEQREYKDGGKAEVLGDLDALAEPDTALIFVQQAKRLGVEVGDMLTISAPTPRGVNNTADVRVVAIAKDIGFLSGWGIFVPSQTVRDIYRLAPDTTGALQIYLKDPGELDAVANRLRELLAERGYRLMEPLAQPFWMKFEVVNREDWTGQKLDVTTWKDEMEFMSWTIKSFHIVMWSLIGILMLVIAVGISNTLWISVRERTREIGTMRAIGMSRPRVGMMFLFEAGLLGLFSTGAGALVATAIALVVNRVGVVIPIEAFQLFTLSETLWLAVDVRGVALAVGVLTLFTVVAAQGPALRASRLRPVTAIHHIG